MPFPITLITAGLYCPPPRRGTVTKEVRETIVGQVTQPARVVGQIIEPPRLVGQIRNCPTDGGQMTDLSMVRGDDASFPFVVLDDPDVQAGVWTWDGSLTVLASVTAGVVIGDWVRAPALTDGNPSPWFKVTAVNANVDVTIENPDELDVPSASGADGASPIDLTGAVIRATAKRGTRVVVSSNNYRDPDGVEMTAAVDGEGIWHITPNDQVGDKSGDTTWDIETNRQGALRTSTGGTMTPTAGSGLLTFSDVAVVAGAGVGDVFIGTGSANGVNQIPVVITATPSDDENLSATELRTDYDGYIAEAGFSFELRRGIRKTPDDLSGTLTLRHDSTT